MSEDRLYVNHVEHITSLLMDLLIFWIKSIYFIAESIYLTILPNRFRKLKVRICNGFYCIFFILYQRNSTFTLFLIFIFIYFHFLWSF